MTTHKHCLLRITKSALNGICACAADHDDRVVPLHSYKFISTLQYNLAEYPDSPQRNPLLLRVDHNAGHGGGECSGPPVMPHL